LQRVTRDNKDVKKTSMKECCRREYIYSLNF